MSAVRECVVLWGVREGLAALGTAVLFEAATGANWGLWTIGAAGAVALWTLCSGAHLSAPLLVVLWLSGMLGVGAAVTADGFFHVLIASAVLAPISSAMRRPGSGAGSPLRSTRAAGSRSSPPWRHSARC